MTHTIVFVENSSSFEKLDLKSINLNERKIFSFDITSQHLGKVLRDNNKTRKRTKHQHFPATRYGVEINKQQTA